MPDPTHALIDLPALEAFFETLARFLDEVKTAELSPKAYAAMTRLMKNVDVVLSKTELGGTIDVDEVMAGETVRKLN